MPEFSDSSLRIPLSPPHGDTLNRRATPQATPQSMEVTAMGKRGTGKTTKGSGLNIGDRVKYVGRHPEVLRLHGHFLTGTITGERDPWGFTILYDDGTEGSAVPRSLETLD